MKEANLRDINKFRAKQIVLMSFAFIFLITFLNGILQKKIPIMYDASVYWTSGEMMFDEGHFDLSRFENPFRGYFLIVFYTIIKGISKTFFQSEFLLFHIFIASIMAILWTIFLPQLFEVKRNNVKFLVGNALSYLVFLYFWRNTLVCPLSDVPAMFFMFASIWLMRFLLTTELTTDGLPVYQFMLISCIIGAIMYIAYNTRTIYLYGIIAQLIWFIIKMRSKKKHLILFVVAFTISVFISGSPQAYINYSYGQQPTIQVLTSLYSGDEQLEKLQLLWGVEIERYETYVGNPEEYPQAAVRFESDTGKELIRREGITRDNFSYMTIIKLLIKYPLEMISIYTTHFISYLTPFYTEPYIANLFTNKIFTIIIAIILWIAGAVAIYANCKKNKNRHKFANAISCVGIWIPMILISAGAPEIRFFIALYLVWYFCLGCCVDWRITWCFIKRNLVGCAIVCIVIFLLWTSMAQKVLNTNVVIGRPMIITDSLSREINS